VVSKGFYNKLQLHDDVIKKTVISK
jgi:hypothetical protein